MKRAMPVSLFVLVLFSSTAAAQSDDLSAGDRIRVVRFAGSGFQELILSSLRSDTVFVRTATTGPESAIALSEVRRIDVYRGPANRRSLFLKRVAIGAGVGALAGGLLVSATDDDDFFGESAAAKFAIGAIGGVVVGSAGGAVAGLAGLGSGRWETVYPRALR